MNKENALKFFANTFFKTSTAEILSDFSKFTHIKSLAKKEILFYEGETGSTVYFLVNGNLKLYKTNEEGKTMIIHIVRPGEIFAEILFFLQNRYPVTAEAISDSTLLGIDANKMLEYIKNSPEFSLKIIGALSGRIKELLNKIETLTLEDIRTRFLNYIKRLSNQKRSKTVTLPVKKGDLAMMLGIRQETFSRLLKKLQEENIISINKNEITILQEL
ncbi:CRP/FNR family transcriptional regulator, anaerobic regulatory protein [Deferribacter desulfuricans SSM1]|uniref:CRP/FNR family transcriptional regulator, anaerobic regulatory protein n=1 Tax=Deferribacter desulfuricans (strain DSM 14783 / JCM 11476 / NBRC 101012 / SSM1) TaxID=639282 RepID=D3PEI3_DEFDS|nr:Crp/Fnr family transcriptional regulator [Deferribacter desulfuricans]BAI81006.1 CRP/FNR family transcriptional regulator, anaerobic regulatory protein [Deferribacter desulfuricans SSM1]